MPLGTPSNLSLGRLGHIAGGNSGTTNQTSLAATCRGANSQTSMWADFKIGTPVLVNLSGVFDGSAKGYFKIRVRNDVGEYMGGGASGETVDEFKVGVNDENSYWFEIQETNAGSLYTSKIANNSTNASDYQAEWQLTDGSAGFAYQQDGTQKDKWRFFGV